MRKLLPQRSLVTNSTYILHNLSFRAMAMVFFDEFNFVRDTAIAATMRDS